jgi:hypothetical protein
MLKKIAQALNLPENITAVALKVKSALEANNIENVVIGGIAIGKYSLPRTTADVDFLVKGSDINKINSLFGSLNPLSLPEREGYTISFDGVDVDFIIASEQEENFLFTNKSDYHQLNVPSVFNVIYLKMKSGRTKDINDVIQICKKLSKQERNDIISFLKLRIRENDLDRDSIEDFKSSCMIADLEESKKKTAKDMFYNYLKKITT